MMEGDGTDDERFRAFVGALCVELQLDADPAEIDRATLLVDELEMDSLATFAALIWAEEWGTVEVVGVEPPLVQTAGELFDYATGST